MSFGVVRKVVQNLERKEVQTMPETKSFAESVIKRRIRELEEELEPSIKPTVGFGQLTGKVDPRDLEVIAKLDKYGCAYEPPLERPEVKVELNRLRLLEVANPALAYREVTYAQPNRLIDLVGLPPKPQKKVLQPRKQSEFKTKCSALKTSTERTKFWQSTCKFPC
jgi:hypothetical protein